MKQARSFTISQDILEAIADTKGSVSASERVNELLRRALDLEQRERLEQEAAEFFTKQDAYSTRERAAFRKASKQSLSRD
jgi:hypothetical protein